MDNYYRRLDMARKFQRILGINFYVGDMPDLLNLCAEGHFIVVPAAPALADLPTNEAYRESLEKSDFAITDSALMVLMWKFFTGQTLPRISGLKLLRGLLAGDTLHKPGSSFWIMPSKFEMDVNLAWLNQNGYPVTAGESYVAPMYPKGPISDPAILAWIEAHKPPYIIINLGGGGAGAARLLPADQSLLPAFDHLRGRGGGVHHRLAGEDSEVGRRLDARLVFSLPPRADEIHSALLEGAESDFDPRKISRAECHHARRGN